MATIFVHITDSAGVGITGLTPTLTYWSKAVPAAPVATVNLQELLGGVGVKNAGYFVDVTTVDGEEYLGLIDGLATSVPRVHPVSFSGETDARIEIDIPEILDRSPLIERYMTPWGYAVTFDGTLAVPNTGTVSGTDGTIANPVSSEASARTIADNLGLRATNVKGGVLTLSSSYGVLAPLVPGWKFFGQTGATVDLNGQESYLAEFEGGVRVSGAHADTAGFDLIGHRCIVQAATGLSGRFHQCEIDDSGGLSIGTAANTGLTFVDCWSQDPPSSRPDLTLGGAAASFLRMHRYSGQFGINTMSNAASVVVFDGAGAHLVVAVSVTFGTIYVRGGASIDTTAAAAAIIAGDLVIVFESAVSLAETEVSAAARATALNTLLSTTGVVLTAAARTAIWDEDVTGREASPNTAARIQDMQNKLMRGRIRTNPTLNQLELYDPADDTVLLTWPLTDFAGDPIANAVGAPFDRAKAVET